MFKISYVRASNILRKIRILLTKQKTGNKEKKIYCICNTFAILKKYIAVCRCRSENGKERKNKEK
jgi:hypothetical protein